MSAKDLLRTTSATQYLAARLREHGRSEFTSGRHHQLNRSVITGIGVVGEGAPQHDHAALRFPYRGRSSDKREVVFESGWLRPEIHLRKAKRRSLATKNARHASA